MTKIYNFINKFNNKNKTINNELNEYERNHFLKFLKCLVVVTNTDPKKLTENSLISEIFKEDEKLFKTFYWTFMRNFDLKIAKFYPDNPFEEFYTLDQLTHWMLMKVFEKEGTSHLYK